MFRLECSAAVWTLSRLEVWLRLCFVLSRAYLALPLIATLFRTRLARLALCRKELAALVAGLEVDLTYWRVFAFSLICERTVARTKSYVAPTKRSEGLKAVTTFNVLHWRYSLRQFPALQVSPTGFLSVHITGLATLPCGQRSV